MTKPEQLKKNGKMRKQSIKDGKYLSNLHKIGLSCIVCGSNNIELHHVYSVLDGVERSDHRVIPLCSDHHRGSKCSPHGGVEAFYTLFPFDELVFIADRIRENYLAQCNKI